MKKIIFLTLFVGTVAHAENATKNKSLHITCYESKIKITEIDANEASVSAWSSSESSQSGELIADNSIRLRGTCFIKSN